MSLSTIPDLFERTLGRLPVSVNYLLLAAMAGFWLAVGQPLSAGLTLGAMLVLGLVHAAHLRRSRELRESHERVLADLQRVIDDPTDMSDGKG